MAKHSISTPLPVSRRRMALRKASATREDLAGELRCPVERMGQEVTAILRAEAPLDGLNPSERTALMNIADNSLYDRRKALVELASATPASSMRGAMFQIVAAEDALQVIEEEAADTHASRVAFRHVRCVLFSILGVLEKESGVSRSEMGGDLLPADPIEAMEEALAGDLLSARKS